MQIDAGRLAACLADHFSRNTTTTKNATSFSFRPPLDVRQFKFGQSNPTSNAASGNKFVLRKKPPGQLLSKKAHAVEREYRVINALYSKSSVPVPRVHLLCEDSSVIGTPFYVMEFLKGRIFPDNRIPELSPQERILCYTALMDTLARLHTAPIATLGLQDYSRTPTGFYQRQVATLTTISQQQHASDPARVPAIPRLADMTAWFARNAVAEEPPTVVHGDFKLDNVVFHPTDAARIIGVLDWELSTLGHPLSDLANCLLPWYMPSGLASMLPGGVGFKDAPRPLPVPEADELIKEYCTRAGRSYPIQRFEFCIAFSFFRLIVIIQGVSARAARKQASSSTAVTIDDKVMAQVASLVLGFVDAGDLGAAKL
ncbi:hypothetical protein HDU82_007834 [Entophlyctis luteolus]|nr:hypothetical protein HDU82_007834 [Entophlyctis luteolus]